MHDTVGRCQRMKHTETVPSLQFRHTPTPSHHPHTHPGSVGFESRPFVLSPCSIPYQSHLVETQSGEKKPTHTLKDFFV